MGPTLLLTCPLGLPEYHRANRSPLLARTCEILKPAFGPIGACGGLWGSLGSEGSPLEGLLLTISPMRILSVALLSWGDGSSDVGLRAPRLCVNRSGHDIPRSRQLAHTQLRPCGFYLNIAIVVTVLLTSLLLP